VKSGWRILMLAVVMLPMMIVGAYLSLAQRDVYTVYAVCGRFLPISPVTDQQLGGLIIWIAGAFTIGVVFLFVFARMLEHERAIMGPRVAKPALTK
jgi:putative membrane protein